VLINLLQNAIKFTPNHGRIIVRVKDEENTIQVQVVDTGMGIKKEDLERVFEPFSAIKKATYVKGTGLGMSVARGLIQTHGGRIWAESPGEGQGATFTFTLPRRKELS
jgi:two-component system phosphate regulon sensor histidine kinase PhoR